MLIKFAKGLLLKNCEQPTVLGCRLLPFSLGHCFILRVLGNRYVTGGEDGSVSLDDMITFAVVCSRTWASIGKILFNGGLKKEVFLLGSKNKKTLVAAENQKIITYINEYMDFPEHWHKEKEEKSSMLRSPWEMYLVYRLSKNIGKPIDECWDLPVNYAKCWNDIAAEIEGDRSLVDETEAAIIEAQKKGEI